MEGGCQGVRGMMVCCDKLRFVGREGTTREDTQKQRRYYFYHER